jgi:hypothetical protein
MALAPQESTRPLIRYHRVKPLILHTDPWLHIADGVIEDEDGVAWFGQVRGTGPAFTVAGFLIESTHAYAATPGWQADVIATSIDDDGGGSSPTWGAALRREALAALPLARTAAEVTA